MTSIIKCICLMLPLILVGCASTKTPVVPGQTARSFETTITVGYDYLLYVPDQYEEQEHWPLMVFLHGAGERGADLEKVKAHGPPKLVADRDDFPFLVVSPQAPEGERWNEEILMALVDDVIAKYNVDPDRVYVTGLSMGGYGTWALGMAYPDRFAALVPICGGGEPEQADVLADVPVWVFHGAKDPVVPIEQSERMVEALEQAGGNVQLTVYPEADHDSWTETYNNPEVFEWMLEQRRSE